jgi:hypothetical protein
MKKQLSDYPEWVDVNAAVERARMELRAIAEGKAAIETALSKAKRGEADEWEAFKEGGAGEESDGVGLRAQYRDLEQRERFVRKALDKGQQELASITDDISVQVCQGMRPQFLELIAKLLGALKTVSECNDALWQLHRELEDQGIRTGSLPVSVFPIGRWDDKNGGRIPGATSSRIIPS